MWLSCVTPVVELIYTRRDFFGKGSGCGGYFARIAGFGEQGRGAEVEEALEDLYDRLREAVVARDTKAYGEPGVIGWARDELRTSTLADAIRRQACEPVLADGDDPRS